MRHAKYKDYWEKVNRRTPAHSAITVLQYRGISFNFSNIHVVSGQNGSGKSSLLKLFSSSKTLRPSVFEELTFSTQVSSLEQRDLCNFQYTSPSWLVEENRKRLDEIRFAGQFEDYLNGIEPFVFGGPDLERVNYVLNTSFSQIRLFELDVAQGYQDAADNETTMNDGAEGQDATAIDSYSEDLLEGRALYVEASITNDEARHTYLSQGERYIILLIYLIGNIKGRSIFIDEPETYLSPLSQYRLSDVLAFYSVENKCQFILATHSVCFIERVDSMSTLMLDGAHNGRLDLNTGKKVSSYLRRLGYKVPKENIALFEDEGAKRFFSNIAREFDADWLSSMELISLNGESDITSIIERVKSYKITAVYDADQRGKTLPEKYKEHHVTFLPGKLAPEQELLAVLKENAAQYAEKLRIRLPDLNGYLGMIQGLDHHDYFGELARLTHLDKWKLFDEAFSIWAPMNRPAIEEFLAGFS